MPYVPLISVLIAVTALVPIVGAFAGCIVGAFLIMVEAGIVKALWFVVMFLIIQQIEGNLIYPKVVGTSIGLPGMWVLVAVTIGGELMGVAGMLVMIPLVSVLYTLGREFTNSRLEERGIPAAKLEAQPILVPQKINRAQERNKRIKLQKMKEEFLKTQELLKKKSKLKSKLRHITSVPVLELLITIELTTPVLKMRVRQLLSRHQTAHTYSE